MKKNLFGLFTSLCVTCVTIFIAVPSSFAALPPFYHSVQDLKAILDSAEVAAQLGSHRMISSIERMERKDRKQETHFLIKAGGCSLDVEVKRLPLPGGMVGPGRIELKLGKTQCS